jgi:hypothetical protein
MDLPVSDIFGLIRPFIRRMDRGPAFDALEELVQNGTLTVGEVAELFQFWSRDDAAKATKTRQQERRKTDGND